MEKRELETKAEQYKREMMQMYGRSCTVKPQIEEQSDAVEEPEAEEQQTDEHTDEAREEISADDEPQSDIAEAEIIPDIDERYPEPDLSILDDEVEIFGDTSEEPHEYPDEESMGTSSGFIIVNVRTGRDSGIVDGAGVTVAATVNGKRMILASGKTDLSGAAPPFKLPAPPPEYSQIPDSQIRPYSLFDIIVTAKGFFNSISVDVPVFSGITSIQNFNMVPLPLLMNPDDETVVYYNQESLFQGTAAEGE